MSVPLFLGGVLQVQLTIPMFLSFLPFFFLAEFLPFLLWGYEWPETFYLTTRPTIQHPITFFKRTYMFYPHIYTTI